MHGMGVEWIGPFSNAYGRQACFLAGDNEEAWSPTVGKKIVKGNVSGVRSFPLRHTNAEFPFWWWLSSNRELIDDLGHGDIL